MSLRQFELLATRLAKIKEVETFRANYRAALICSIMAEPYRDKTKKLEPFSPKDFMPQAPKTEEELEKERMDAEQLQERISHIQMMLGYYYERQ